MFRLEWAGFGFLDDEKLGFDGVELCKDLVQIRHLLPTVSDTLGIRARIPSTATDRTRGTCDCTILELPWLRCRDFASKWDRLVLGCDVTRQSAPSLRLGQWRIP